MNKTNILAFVIGAAAGTAVTWYIMKKKCDQRIQEEINSVKAVFSYPKYDGPQDSDEAAIEREMEEKKERVLREKPDVTDYAKRLDDCGYVDYASKAETFEGPRGTYKAPYVISPDEFGELEDYDRITLLFYSDHVLTDDNNEVIEDVESTVGVESLNHFGEYEDDSVFVRNERLRVDYEILLDQRKYSDVLESKPYLKED